MAEKMQEVVVEMTIDFELLREQKRLLLELSEEHRDLDGLVFLIDHIQDTFYRQLLSEHGKEYADKYANRYVYLMGDAEGEEQE